MADEARKAVNKSRLMPALLLLLSGCASIPQNVRELPDDATIELDSTPFFPQERYQCGPAALTTVLVKSGARADLDRIVDEVYLPGREGSLQVELVAASRRYDRIPYVIDGTLRALHAELQAGRPVLVLQNLGVAAVPRWHYAVVAGIDVDAGNIILRSGTDRRRATPIMTFLRTWRRGDYWGFVVLRPEELPAVVDRERYLAAVSALEETGRTSAAATAWRTATSRWPGDRVVQFGLANAEFAFGRLEAAEAGYRALLATDAGFIAARNNLALVLADQGRLEEARQEIAEALRLNESEVLEGELRDSASRIRQMAEETHSAAPAAPTLDDIRNSTIVGLFEDPVTLRDGRWEGEPYVAGGTSRPTAGVIDDLTVVGDLDSDGTEETVAFLWSATGGSGTRNYIAVFTNSGTGVSNRAIALIGDRVKVREVRIVEDRIEVDVVEHGPGDAMCCPSVETTRVWHYDGRNLREAPRR